ncbi:hypothetical protein GGR51DRAFT_529273 [Nemania sp. FL0031]|nr:hypothetical protein GGR51DRAFT_529273 [Nemania sp. FL0031]
MRTYMPRSRSKKKKSKIWGPLSPRGWLLLLLPLQPAFSSLCTESQDATFPCRFSYACHSLAAAPATGDQQTEQKEDSRIFSLALARAASPVRTETVAVSGAGSDQKQKYRKTRPDFWGSSAWRPRPPR